MSKNLVLTGMMGVGKSTIGKKLAKKLSFTFVDIDKIIELKEGCSINQIFKKKNETYFRKLENDISLRELNKHNSVISLGGGAFLNNAIRKAVKNTCISFWLDVSLVELIKRLRRSRKRPLLFRKNLDEEIYKIYLKRKKTYNEADYKIKCNFLKQEIVVKKIIRLYENSRN